MKYTRKSFSFILWMFLGITLHYTSQGQTLQGGLAPSLPSASAASYYYIAKPGELTKQINIWGYVRNPGRYEVSSATDLVQLLSFAGGPIQYAKLDEVTITRVVSNDSAQPRTTLVVNLEHLEKVTPSQLLLYPGDTIYIDASAWVTVRDVFTVAGSFAIIVTAIAQIINLSN